MAEGFMADILGAEYEAVYGIHTDKENTHIHIIWNSVNLVTGRSTILPKEIGRIIYNRLQISTVKCWTWRLCRRNILRTL